MLALRKLPHITLHAGLLVLVRYMASEAEYLTSNRVLMFRITLFARLKTYLNTLLFHKNVVLGTRYSGLS